MRRFTILFTLALVASILAVWVPAGEAVGPPDISQSHIAIAQASGWEESDCGYESWGIFGDSFEDRWGTGILAGFFYDMSDWCTGEYQVISGWTDSPQEVTVDRDYGRVQAVVLLWEGEGEPEGPVGTATIDVTFTGGAAHHSHDIAVSHGPGYRGMEALRGWTNLTAEMSGTVEICIDDAEVCDVLDISDLPTGEGCGNSTSLSDSTGRTMHHGPPGRGGPQH